MTLAAFAPAWAMTTVWVVVPAIGREWSLGAGGVHWVASGFLAAMLPAMLATPLVLRRLGVQRTAVLALALLACGGALGAAAPTFEVLVASRLLEGVAAGVLQPLPVLVIARSVPAGRRGHAMGHFTLGLTLAPALSPAAAGMLAETLGWRSVLLSSLPFVLLGVIALWRAAPRETPPSSAARMPGRAMLSQAHFLRASGVAFAYGFATFAGAYLVPVFAQTGLGHGAAAAGAALLPSGLALAAASPVGGRLADRWPRHRVIAAGLLLFGLAHLPVLWLTPATPLAWLAAWMVASRIGMAMALPSLAMDALRDLPETAWASAASLVSLARQFGATLGIALAALFLEARVASAGTMLPAFHDSFVLVAAVSAAAALAAWRNGPQQAVAHWG